MATYHRGWTDSAGRPTPDASSGKGLRPALALWSAQAAGASPETGIPAAVAVELIHDFSLVHDDIMDGDTIRRGRDTVWTVYGTGPAVLLGDALHAQATVTLVAARSHSRQAVARLAETTAELCRGQAQDLALEHRDQASVQDYLAMVEGKTGALMRCATTLGAILVDAEPDLISDLDRIGHHLGVLFQVVDDMLGLFGDPSVTGKSIRSDLSRRKKTLPILAAAASTTTAGQELADLLHRSTLDEHDLNRAARLVEEAGGSARAWDECVWHHDQAVAVLTRMRLDADSDAVLRDLLTYLLNRIR
ncbi:polyprenyl synthetase family protein [Qaidamihabitans albus]|uniref:polyprenyl synthetase family protein n=1 Tax=Qaidamihabitans albus TaxID=2795733 RepID=UPI001F259FB9|nr:polyprenyl synthetase family protein [Qaidamihabitans albus]